MKSSLRRSSLSQPRRGMALYVSVLMTTLIVSLLGITGMAAMRIQRADFKAMRDITHAHWNARSAVELGLVVLAGDDDWRTNYTSGVESTKRTLGSDATGTLSWILTDSDGDLTDSDTELTLRGVGRVGDTVQVMQVSLEIGKLTSLESALHAENLLTIDGIVLANDHTVSSNNTVTATNSTEVQGNVEAVNAITGGDYEGTTTTNITPRSMPADDVFDYYLANGTTIAYSDLGSGKIDDVVLSPEINPYGTPNALGIYVIDCDGSTIKICDCRIVGTLVLLNPATNSEVGSDHVHWEPAVSNFPSLLVSGSIKLKTEYGADLLDEDKSGNLNPIGTPFPYRGGVEDEDDVDTWPSKLIGLFYATGEIEISHKDHLIEGVVISGQDLIVKSDTQITYSPVFSNNPPPGFTSSELQVVSGSWSRAAAP